MSQESRKVCLEGTIADADKDDDLKVFLDNEVSCVDFSIGACIVAKL